MLKTSIEYNSKRYIELTLKKMKKYDKSKAGQKEGHLTSNLREKSDMNFSEIDHLFEKMVKNKVKYLFNVSVVERNNSTIKKDILKESKYVSLNSSEHLIKDPLLT